MPTNLGGSSIGSAAVAISGSGQQGDLTMDVDPPTNESIDVDEDKNKPDDAEKQVRRLRVSVWRSCDRSCSRSCSSSSIHPLWLSTATIVAVEGCVPIPVERCLYTYVTSCRFTTVF